MNSRLIFLRGKEILADIEIPPDNFAALRCIKGQDETLLVETIYSTSSYAFLEDPSLLPHHIPSVNLHGTHAAFLIGNRATFNPPKPHKEIPLKRNDLLVLAESCEIINQENIGELPIRIHGEPFAATLKDHFNRPRTPNPILMGEIIPIKVKPQDYSQLPLALGK